MALSETSEPGKPFRTLIALSADLFAVWRLDLLIRSAPGSPVSLIVALLMALIEVGAAYYLISNIVRSAVYAKLLRRRTEPLIPSASRPRVAFVYLACEDVDEEALGSLARVHYDGPLFVIVHDDSRTHEGREMVSRAVERFRENCARPVILLRRPVRRGGKPGAVNWVIERTAFLHDYFVLLDNDSFVMTPEFIPGAITHFNNPSVGAVQFRNRGLSSPREPAMQRLLASAVDAFDVFVRWYAFTGLMPFLGHNAMVRTARFREVGGLAEGVFSDDIDFTVRLAMEGQRVVYEPRIEFGERHPASFGAFRRRCQKWAYGCMQILGRHLVPALRSGRLNAGQKLWLIEFACFYAFQSLLLPYLLLAYVAAPLTGATAMIGTPASLLLGGTILAAIMAPTLAYFSAHGRVREWWRSAWCCALVYGASCFATARGVAEYATGLSKEWIPTNARREEKMLWLATLGESAFGALLFVIPLAIRPEILMAPSSQIFVAIFLFSPLVHRFYRGARTAPGFVRSRSPRKWRTTLMWTASTVLAMAMASLAVTTGRDHPDAARKRVEVRGDSLLVDGKPFVVKGIHYSPWLPGTGPAGGSAWHGGEVVERDMVLLRSLNVNTLLVHDAPAEVVRRAGEEGFMVIVTFTINWQWIRDDDAFQKRLHEITARVADLAGEPSVLMWSLGNEIPEWVLEEFGPDFLSGRLKALHDAVRGADPAHPVTHQNWPITKGLALPFLEVVSFNLYPSWPREVVVRGYGDYIENDLLPTAGGRPLIISEFGANTIEASVERQAETLRTCWQEIRGRTAGGVVFEFVDEWWKNYDNPIDPSDYWLREYAPDDARTHDRDPEEFYGIFTTDRVPKPASQVVAEMFSDDPRWSRAWLMLPLFALFAYSVIIFTREL